jgi:hypothetical protein
METNNLKLNIDVKQILSVLSSSLYKGDVLEVATRELLQNSFDAVKGNAQALIEFKWDEACRCLTVRDNGRGMSPTTVREVFFTVGGTLKEGLDVSERSGGFGIAKVQFFMAAERIRVRSCHHGVVTFAEATQEQLLDGTGKFLIEDASHHSDAFENFTEVNLFFPNSYVNACGEVKKVSYSRWSIRRVLEHPLIGYPYIRINYWGDNYNRLPNFTNSIVESYDWGDLEVLFTPKAEGCYMRAQVHCAGLFQFKHETFFGTDEGIECVINVKPKHPAGSPFYPFANSRDDFSGYAKKDLEAIEEALNKLTKCIKAENIRNAYSSQQTLEYLDVHGIATQSIVGTSNRPAIDWQKLFDGVSFAEMVEIIENQSKALQEYAKKTAEEHQAGKDKLLRLINKTDKRMDDRREIFSKIASIVYDVIYNPTIRVKFAKAPTIAGIVVESGCNGCFLTMDGIHGLYLNPMGEYENELHFAHKMICVLTHELAHSRTDWHDGDFFRNEDLFRNLLFEHNLYTDLQSKFSALYLQYGELLTINY